MFIARDFDRTENDDFILNVAPRMGKYDGAVALYTSDGIVMGWKISGLYE